MKLLFLSLLIFGSISWSQQLSYDWEDDERPLPTKPPLSNIFTVVAPNKVRKGKTFVVYVRGFEVRSSFNVQVQLKPANEGGLLIERSVRLSTSTRRATVRLDTSRIPDGQQSYSLVVSSGDYNVTKSLIYVTKQNSIFVQTNKAIFRPSDLLQYRVYSVDSESKSVNPKVPVTVTLTDPRNNEIGKTANMTFVDGKFEGQWTLPSKPILGRWKLTIQNGEETMTKFVQVDEYTLSLFSASLSVARQVPYSATVFPVTINAEYTFKQPVKGIAAIKIYDSTKDMTYNRNITVNARSTVFYIDIVNDLGYTASQWISLTISMTFIDPKTNTKVTDQEYVSVVPHKFLLQIVGDRAFTPGSAYRYTVVSTTLDGKPAPRVRVTVNVNREESFSLTTSSDGTRRSTFQTSDEHRRLSLEASCSECAQGYAYASAIGLRPSNGIALSLITQEPSFTEDVRIMVTSAEDIDSVYYFVTSKGVLLESGTVYFDDDPRSTEIEISPDFRYAPRMRVYAYQFRKSDGKFVNANLMVDFKPELPNYLKLRLRRSDATGNVVVKPGSNVSLTIESSPYSTVSLAAVDQRVLQLANSQNFTLTQVLDSFNDYEGAIWRGERRRSPPRRYDIYNAEPAGLTFFTNAPEDRRPVSRGSMERPMAEPRESRERLEKPSGRDSEGPRVRKDFREVIWWEDVKLYDEDYETISRKVSDSITTYMLFGVSMNKYDGMGLPANLPSATIYLPFFLSMELPASVKRGETLTINIQVFNYLGSSQDVTLTFSSTGNFSAFDPDGNGWQPDNGQYTQRIRAANGDATVVKFAIRPRAVGVLNIKVSAKTPTAGDALEKPLRVIPEGVPRTITSSVLIAIDANNSSPPQTLQCVLPPSAYQDTADVWATLIGDILGKALNNLDKLIQLPSGCGEQTMVSYVPDYAILVYLETTGKLTDALRTKLVQYLTAGYQNQLRYQRYDGGFSAFGEQDPQGSTWLTAYVARYFDLSRPYVSSVSSSVLENALNFILQQQSEDGSFREPGRVIHVDMQGASGSGVALTAYVAITLTSLLPNYPAALSSRDRAIQFLEAQLSSITDAYSLAVVAYALQLAGSSSAAAAFNSFYARRTETPTETKWTVSTSAAGYYGPRSIDIEVSAYGLLLLVARNEGLAKSLKVVKYLMAQSNSFGGYSSSQDTVMALTALSTFARTYTMTQANVNLRFQPDTGTYFNVGVTPANALSLQSFELLKSTRGLEVSVRSRSTGVAIVSLVCNFYEDPAKVVPSYAFNVDFEGSCQYRVQMKICPRLISGSSPNMAIMEVRMPSGYYYYNAWWLRASNDAVSKIETYEDNTVVVFYFNSVSSEGACVSFGAGKTFDVGDLKPGSITITDYYDTSKQGSASFSISEKYRSIECTYVYCC